MYWFYGNDYYVVVFCAKSLFIYMGEIIHLSIFVVDVVVAFIAYVLIVVYVVVVVITLINTVVVILVIFNITLFIYLIIYFKIGETWDILLDELYEVLKYKEPEWFCYNRQQLYNCYNDNYNC